MYERNFFFSFWWGLIGRKGEEGGEEYVIGGIYLQRSTYKDILPGGKSSAKGEEGVCCVYNVYTPSEYTCLRQI